MIDLKQHREVMLRVLREIYSDVKLRKALGFKGGTAAMFFYQLPRMSVDLDFDLLAPGMKVSAAGVAGVTVGIVEAQVWQRLQAILPQFGEIVDASQKYHTLFFLLRYQKYQRNLKIEISCRANPAKYQVKNLLGLSMRVMVQDDMTAHKLAALLNRRVTAARDFFDVWYLLKEDWPIDEAVLRKQTGLSVVEVWQKVLRKTQQSDTRTLLHGLGELVNEKQKQWLRDKFKEELIFLLRMKLEGNDRVASRLLRSPEASSQ